MNSLFVFIFGTIIGSFLNVVILRYDKKPLTGRSACISCDKKLAWYELIPVLSFLIQRGKCTNCKKNISWQYPIVEITTGLLFLLISNFEFQISNGILNFEIFEYLKLLYYFIIFSILIVITVYDIKHKIIPDSLVFSFIGVSLLFLLFNYQTVSFLDWFAGPILAFPFAFLWFISDGRWIGFGDAKLALGIGWFMGLVDGVSSIILAFWIGSVFGVALILLSKLGSLSFMGKNFTIKSEIPFAPFLILGMIIVFFFGWDILGIKFLVSSF